MQDKDETSLVEGRDVRAWQYRLLPVMVAMVVGLALFFFAASMYQLYSLQNSITESPSLDLTPVLSGMDLADDLDQAEALLKVQRWKTLALLEDHTVKQRYHQANVLLMSRVWVRYLGFVTGMILALVGAVFVLGKIRETRTDLGVEHKDVKGTLSTSSPGLVLATLGSILMITTLVTHHKVVVRDGPLYVLLPYTKVQLPGGVKTAPEDVMRLSAQPGEPGGVGYPEQGTQSGAGSQEQLDLDNTFKEIDALINPPTQ